MRCHPCQNVHADVSRHGVVMQAEFEDICEEAQLWTKLQDLEQLCQEQGIYEGEVQATG